MFWRNYCIVVAILNLFSAVYSWYRGDWVWTIISLIVYLFMVWAAITEHDAAMLKRNRSNIDNHVNDYED